MGAIEYFRRLFGTQPEGDAQSARGPSGTEPQSRRRARAAGDRAALWTEQPETCESCGRRLLTGELPALMQRGDDSLLVCPLCATDLAAAGFRVPRPPADHPAALERDAA